MATQRQQHAQHLRKNPQNMSAEAAHSVCRWAGLAVVFALLGPACLSAAEFEPARFRENMSLERYISFPKGDGDVSLSLPCQSFVTTDGQMEKAYCYLFEDDEEQIYWYFQAINLARYRARLTPARVDGIRRRVLMHFTVRFERRNNSEAISVKLNHGGNAAIYGDDYLDPQLYWRPPTAVRPCISGIKLSWAVSMVDKSGKALQTKVVPESMSTNCESSLDTYLSGSLYIPAFADGEAVDAYFGNPLFR